MFNKSNWAIAKRMIAFTLVCGTSTTLVLPNQSAIAGDRSIPHAKISNKDGQTKGDYKHVLIISVDGLRIADVADPSVKPSLPNILGLAQTGVTYNNAVTTSPSDSFPGTLAYFTGAGPKTTGVYYDDSYDRQLTAPGGTATDPRGTETNFAENIDKNPDLLSGGGDFSPNSIDPALLPLNCNSGTCNPFYPHNFVKVNTIFEVAKAAGLHTAYSEKHPSYDIINGPSGKGVDDLYTPEINAKVSLQNGKLVDDPNGKKVTNDYKLTEAYDDLKVNSVLNEIKGLNSLGTKKPGVPAIFGLNFQAVSVAQKDRAAGGYNEDGTPSAEFLDAVQHTDASIGQIVQSLKDNNLFDSTLVVVVAKHGQNPRIGKANLVADSILTGALKNAGIEVAQATQDDVALLWLKDQNQAQQASDVLAGLKAVDPVAGGLIDGIFSGDELLKRGLGNPLTNSRTPDLIVTLSAGYVLVGNPATSPKRAEHGGFTDDDTHIALIVGSGKLPSDLKGTSRDEFVRTTQIAVTTLEALGLDPDKLQGARKEKTQALPGLGIQPKGE